MAATAGPVKEQWGNLTDDELDGVAGKLDQLAGLIQGKYGYAREHIEAEIEHLLGEDRGVRAPAEAGGGGTARPRARAARAERRS